MMQIENLSSIENRANNCNKNRSQFDSIVTSIDNNRLFFKTMLVNKIKNK